MAEETPTTQEPVVEPETQFFDFSSGLNTIEDARAELAALRDKIVYSKPVDYAKQDRAFTELRSADLQAKQLSPGEQMLRDTAAVIYSRTKATNPLDSPEFEQELIDQQNRQLKTLQDTLTQELSAEFLPAQDSPEFARIARSAQELRALYKEAQAQNKPFGEVWLSNVDTSKFSYLDRLKYNMQARTYELAIQTGKPFEEVEALVQKEFGDTIDKVKADPKFAQLMSMTPDQQYAAFKREAQLQADYQKNNALIGTVSTGVKSTGILGKLPLIPDVIPFDERTSGTLIAGLTTDLLVSSLPIVGNSVGTYIAATGDDIVINTITGEKDKLPWWGRALVALPVIGPLFRAGKQLPKIVQNTLAGRYGVEQATFIAKGGVNRVRAGLAGLKEGEVDHILRSIANGEIVVDEADEALVQVLKSLTNTNKGAALAMLRRGDLIESPIAALARNAIISGDDAARQKIVQTIFDASVETNTARAQKITDALGVDSDGLQLILRDIRSIENPTAAARAAERSVLDARIKADRHKQKLANLQKATEARKLKRAEKFKAAQEAQAAAEEAEKRAQDAPVFEDITTKDAPSIEEARVGDTLPAPEGEVRVVDVTDDVITTVDSRGEIQELSRKLTVDQREYVLKRVRELGSFENVDALYHDDTIGRYARLVAADIFKSNLSVVGQQAAEKVRRALKLKTANAQLEAVVGKLDAGEAVIDDLDNLIARVEEDIINHPEAAGVAKRQELVNKMRTIRNEQVGGIAADNVSVQKSQKAKGTELFIVDSRSGKARPAAGLPPKDASLNPHDVIVARTEGAFEVIAQGDDARPLTPKAYENMTEPEVKHILRKGNK